VLHNWPEPLWVFVDYSQLLRVCNNLLQNAMQAIPENKQGILTVTLQKTAHNTVQLRVQDNGVGISEEAKTKIFSPYFTTKTSGTGLGLARTLKIVEVWQGRIWLETNDLEGATFIVELPIDEGDKS
jgi:signal transduction histidine kinase